jgi:outer membrane murein-binding lipoprotein Lpp
MEYQMLLKNLTAAVMALSMLAGCSSLSNEQKANLDRDQEVGRIIAEIDTVGYEVVNVSPGVDEFLNGLSAFVEQQRNVALQYRDIVKDHRDVTSFLAANEGKTEQELQAEAKRFDLGAKNEKDKIGNKLAAYRDATRKISEENSKLTIELVKQGAQLTYLATQYGTEIAQIAAINTAMSFFKGDNDEKEALTVPTAVMRATDQFSLLNEINGLINADQEVAESLNQLQEQLDARG